MMMAGVTAGFVSSADAVHGHDQCDNAKTPALPPVSLVVFASLAAVSLGGKNRYHRV